MKELVLKRCLKCGALVEVFEDCTCDDCGIKCCGQNMVKVAPNSVDAAFEKHVPTFEVKGDKIVVKVNHVMQDDHFIEWIVYLTENEETKICLRPGQEAIAKFNYKRGAKLYAYCNKHGLWEAEVK